MLVIQLHAKVILSQDVLDYAPLFAEIADAYFERQLYADARPIYELLGADAAVSAILMRSLLTHSDLLFLLSHSLDSRPVAYTSSSKQPHAYAC